MRCFCPRHCPRLFGQQSTQDESLLLVSVGPDLDELGLGPLEEVGRVGDVEEVESDEWRHGRVDPLLRRVLALFQRQSLNTRDIF